MDSTWICRLPVPDIKIREIVRYCNIVSSAKRRSNQSWGWRRGVQKQSIQVANELSLSPILGANSDHHISLSRYGIPVYPFHEI